jgi:hypothetical protein
MRAVILWFLEKRALDSPNYFRSFIAEPTAQRFVAELTG